MLDSWRGMILVWPVRESSGDDSLRLVSVVPLNHSLLERGFRIKLLPKRVFAEVSG